VLFESNGGKVKNSQGRQDVDYTKFRKALKEKELTVTNDADRRDTYVDAENEKVMENVVQFVEWQRHKHQQNEHEHEHQHQPQHHDRDRDHAVLTAAAAAAAQEAATTAQAAAALCMGAASVSMGAASVSMAAASTSMGAAFLSAMAAINAAASAREISVAAREVIAAAREGRESIPKEVELNILSRYREREEKDATDSQINWNTGGVDVGILMCSRHQEPMTLEDVASIEYLEDTEAQDAICEEEEADEGAEEATEADEGAEEAEEGAEEADEADEAEEEAEEEVPSDEWSVHTSDDDFEDNETAETARSDMRFQNMWDVRLQRHVLDLVIPQLPPHLEAKTTAGLLREKRRREDEP
jgi:hypothetical protein